MVLVRVHFSPNEHSKQLPCMCKQCGHMTYRISHRTWLQVTLSMHFFLDRQLSLGLYSSAASDAMHFRHRHAAARGVRTCGSASASYWNQKLARDLLQTPVHGPSQGMTMQV